MNIYLKNFVNLTFIKPGKALDMGAGEFFDVACLRQIGWKCYGVDLKTGVNLDKLYQSPYKLFDLVYSNYVIHKLKNPKSFIKSMHLNLKKGGWIFLHTFDQSDKNSKSKLNKKWMEQTLNEQGFTSIRCRVFSYYDNEPGHKHWHKILEATAQKI